MKLFKRLNIILLCLVATAVFSGAAKKEISPLEVKKFVLDNGMKILIVEDHRSPTVATFIQFKVGGVDERTGITGMSHFLEHMIFKGTKTIGTRNYEEEAPLLKRLDELWAEMRAEQLKGENADKGKLEEIQKEWREVDEKLRAYVVDEEMWTHYLAEGGEHLNASTSKDNTQYFVSLPSNKLELWAWLESDRFSGTILRDFYPERYVVMEERRLSYENSPTGNLVEHIFATAFIAHPYRNPVIGWMSDIEVMRIEDMYDYMRTYYAPNNAVVILVGDVYPEKVMPMIKKYFGRIPSQTPPPPVETKEPPQQGEKRVEVEMQAKPHVVCAYHVPDSLHPDRAAIDFLQILLGGGRTSRLYKRLVLTDQIAAEADCGIWPDIARYPTLFFTWCVPKSSHTAEEIETAVYEEIDRIAKDGATEQEMQKIRNILEAETVAEMENPIGLARLLATYENLGDWEYLLKRRQLYETVTNEDIKRVAREYFAKTNRTVGVIVEKKEIQQTQEAQQ